MRDSCSVRLSLMGDMYKCGADFSLFGVVRHTDLVFLPAVCPFKIVGSEIWDK